MQAITRNIHGSTDQLRRLVAVIYSIQPDFLNDLMKLERKYCQSCKSCRTPLFLVVVHSNVAVDIKIEQIGFQMKPYDSYSLWLLIFFIRRIVRHLQSVEFIFCTIIMLFIFVNRFHDWSSYMKRLKMEMRCLISVARCKRFRWPLLI